MISREEARQRGRDYINSEAGEAAAEAMGALLDALESRGSKQRRRVQGRSRAGLAARADLEAAIGVRGWRRQRIVSTAAGLPPHKHPATHKGIESIFRRGGRDTNSDSPYPHSHGRTRGHSRRPARNLAAAELILAEKGYHGPQAKPGKDSGLRAPTLRQGVNPHDGASEAGRWSLYTRSVTRSARKGSATAAPPSGNSALGAFSAIGPKPGPGPKPTKQPPFRSAWWRLSASWPPHGPTLRTSQKTVTQTTRANSSPASCFGPPGGKATPIAAELH